MKSKKIVKLASLVVLMLGLSGVAQAQKYWGAIYLDKNTGIAGGATDMSNEHEAKQVALNTCIKNHGNRKHDCKLVGGGGFYNGCMSLYMGSNSKGGYGTHGFQLGDAKARAVSACRENGGKGCRETLSFCTTRFY